MIVQVDGWSGSGKSVLMYLLDSHPEVYSHPFHDLIQFLVRSAEKEYEWIKHKDIWGLRDSLARYTQYYKSESFIRQGKYTIEFKAGVHLNYSLNSDFSTVDETIIRTLNAAKYWSPEFIVETILKSFQKELYPSKTDPKLSAIMGGWRGTSNAAQFRSFYPNAKRIAVKRDIRDIIAVQLGRKPVDIDFRSHRFSNKSLEGILCSNEIEDYQKYYSELAEIQKEHPNEVLIIDFKELIHKKDQTMNTVCQFLGLKDLVDWNSTFLGKPIEFDGIDYSDQVLDNYSELLTSTEIKAIQDRILNGPPADNSFNRLLGFLLKKNIYWSKRLLEKSSIN